ncbi:YtpR family tRNA-binding protein [Nautilia sp.]
MIVTRRWLEEFIDLKNVSTREIIDTLNRIGQEVEGYKKYEVPQNVVIGKVIECQKHPNADKLNVCKVDVGDETLQIVCGASNVVNAEYVVVSKVGAVLPGDFKIKKAKLRGVESNGMICAAKEIGLPDFHEGILIMDDSLGELKTGEYAGKYLNDEIIELGVTANRGDCFSVYGIARELSAGLDIDLKNLEYKLKELQEGIGRLVNIEKNEIKHSSHLLKAVKGYLRSNVKIDLRLSFCDIEAQKESEKVLKYSMHATGVLLVLSTTGSVSFENENGVDVYKTKNGRYIVGVRNDIEFEETNEYIINANYINPDYVSEIVFLNSLKTDDYFFRASRGSEPNLKFGINYFINESALPVYSGVIDLINEIPERYINLNIETIRNIIGADIKEKTVVEILKKLKFEVEVFEGNMKVKVPPFRNDIKNIQDVAEEILRIYGIDEIDSKPLEFKEKNRINNIISMLDFVNTLKQKSVSQGFYETLHFVFDDKERLQKYGFLTVDEHLDLVNPIVKELDTLRTTLLLQLFEDVSRNRSNGYKRIFLFTEGSVYNKKREEVRKMAFVISGQNDYENPYNSGKPSKVNFKTMVDKLAQIIGEFRLTQNESHPVAHPYQNAKIILNSSPVGTIAKLHPKIAKDFDIDDTYFAEIDLTKIKNELKLAKEINRFPKVTRDLSLVVNKNTPYKQLFEIIDNLNIIELKDFYPIDIYDLGENNSITVRFVIQGEKTLTDNEINDIMEKILKALESKGIGLR